MPRYAAHLLEELGAARVIGPEELDSYWAQEIRPGYVVHAHCWVLFGQVVEGGIARVEANLDVFVRAAQHFWQKDRLRDAEHHLIRFGDIPPDPNSSSRAHKERRVLRLYCQNPLFVLKLEEAIQRNRIRQIGNRRVGFGDFPLELAIMIIDTVCPAEYTAIEVQNARSLLEAFQWTLPDGYWRKRCDVSPLFEVKRLVKTKARVDWQALGLDMMSLLVEDEVNSGLRAREYVLSLMDGIKRRFFEVL
ncbi:hypothetical protein N7492_001828 [Penicillium capsulatum]|uniref:Uncharacterized protein n=1 Tax=Penicillium capsulatum TaxID=69766 RepID=A0A9W9IUK0_9EURO|nr:hypothetical protein N7492_001828 [Penicillium capsulatum]KAJ6129123.1 hypothetical protein N7512_001903 [Penicillium capsulatum]